MKKLLLSLALVSAGISANAQQSIINPGLTDNVYIGVNVGANTNLAGNKFFPVNPTFGIRIGKDISPIFGVNVEGTAWFGSHIEEPMGKRWDYLPYFVVNENGFPEGDISTGHNFVRGMNIGINSTVNLTNLFCGYLGEPRTWEVSSIIGLGWGHTFTPSRAGMIRPLGDLEIFDTDNVPYFGGDVIYGNFTTKEDQDILTAKTGLDIAYNFGSEKEHQIYVEPAILWNLNKAGYSGIEMNKHFAFLSLSVGYNYKFGCSYGGHNFKLGRDCDAELRRLQALLDECNSRGPRVEIKEVEKIVYRDRPGQTITIDNLKVVPFELNKWYLSEDAQADLNTIKAGSHVQVIGTASPEGNAEWNQELSNNRANAVAEYLENRGVIVDSKEGRGVEGKTSNRLAIVYVIK